MKGYIYVLSLGRDGLYKIGRTTNVARRIHDLRASNPAAHLVGYVITYAASSVEADLHWLFSSQKAEREVFRLKRSDLRKIWNDLKHHGASAEG